MSSAVFAHHNGGVRVEKIGEKQIMSRKSSQSVRNLERRMHFFVDRFHALCDRRDRNQESPKPH
jgi:hypothetical protein